MIQRVRMLGAMIVVLASATLVPSMSASGATSYRVTATLSIVALVQPAPAPSALQRADQGQVPAPSS